jgi:OmpA-OmpF porin, OOP family
VPAPASIATPAPEPAQTEAKIAAAAPLPDRAKTELPKTPSAPATTPGGDCNALVAGVSMHFAFDSAALSQETRATLDKAIDCLKDGRYQVAGHAENVGSSAINQRVSEARARAVFEYLRSLDVDATRLSAIGYGDSRPMAGNTTAAGQAQNRRVVLTRLPQGASTERKCHRLRADRRRCTFVYKVCRNAAKSLIWAAVRPRLKRRL